ncbi:MAG TPA: biopolymer transporter ExbD [Bdellovibrionota bacterium]|jgi:biopolymer transport protein ExbD|nr:biopolymer transporter ExbD [Bdellovibrionota bacterium]
MLDDFEDPSGTTNPKSLNLMPIVDMITTIIFFLLLSSSFVQFTKQTLPPTAVSTSSVEKHPPALNLRLSGELSSPNVYKVRLSWRGASPSQVTKAFTFALPLDQASAAQLAQDLQTTVDGVAKTIGTSEKTVKISLRRNTPYQILITTMDAVKKSYPDIVLNTWIEAENEL